ncbi:MAG: SDR family NAD(P)-dependent oxidoreductase [Proteobacteria bacterium]|nr:SDR family NAD(P)-dependent oxidoreductase [Pseudomonadota bacterium]
MAEQSIVWISGATEGIGAGLARHVPYPDARVINLSRRQHPELETVPFDLTDPSTWPAVVQHFERELSGFSGRRAIFVQNAHDSGTSGYAGEVDLDRIHADVTANVAAPLVLADGFLRACRPGYESGLVLLTSASARVPMQGMSVYCAAKAALEQWVRVVRRERQSRGLGPWVVAVRPGFVDTPSTRSAALRDEREYPAGPALRKALEAGVAVDPDSVARDIWAALPPPPDTSILLFGEVPDGM